MEKFWGEDILKNLFYWGTVGKKGYFFGETLELLNQWSDVGDPFL
jgi:hypothetical protein